MSLSVIILPEFLISFVSVASSGLTPCPRCILSTTVYAVIPAFIVSALFRELLYEFLCVEVQCSLEKTDIGRGSASFHNLSGSYYTDLTKELGCTCKSEPTLQVECVLFGVVCVSCL